MPVHIAFLRAINLGAQRRFPKADIVSATQAAGGSDVQTYLATGNVRLTSPERSARAVSTALETAYAADRGFDVPVIVLSPGEVTEVVRIAAELIAEHGEPKQLGITLYPSPPNSSAIRAAQELLFDDVVLVRGRAAYAFLRVDFHTSKLLRSKEFNALGEGTSRNVNVLREIARRWC